MALVELGPIVQSVSGSMGACTFARRGSKTVARVRSARCNKATVKLGYYRQRFSVVNDAWSQLSDADKLAWDTLAKNVGVQRSSGRVLPGTGRQLFLSENLYWSPGGTVGSLNLPFVRSRTFLVFLDVYTFLAALRFDYVPPSTATIGFLSIAGARSWSKVGFRAQQWQHFAMWGVNGAGSVNLVDYFEGQLGTPFVGELVKIRVRYCADGGMWSLPWEKVITWTI